MEPVRVGEYLDDPRDELRRKVVFLKVVAVVEAVTYALMLVPMYQKWITGNDSDWVYISIRVMGSVHGFIWVAYAYFAWDVSRPLRWSRPFLAAIVLPPIVGGLLCAWRLRREAPTLTDGSAYSSTSSSGPASMPSAARRSSS